MLHGYKAARIAEANRKKVKQKYVLQLTPLKYRRHKRQGQRHRLMIGDVRL